VKHFNKSFLLGEWQNKRKQLLVDLEIAQLPDTQIVVARLKELRATMRVLFSQVSHLRSQALELSQSIKAATREADDIRRRIVLLAKGESKQYLRECETKKACEIAGLRSEYQECQRNITSLDDEHHRVHLELQGLNSLIQTRRSQEIHLEEKEPRDRTRRTFTMPCPVQECLGYMSTRYICGLCRHRICPDCHDPMQPEHVCDPGKVETITLIRREGKPCPKCGTIICKIDGCDQMWCIQCKTAFSWRTGQVETGRIHNPEYFRWMREHGQQLPDACNPILIPMHELNGITHMYCTLDDARLQDAQLILRLAEHLNTIPDVHVGNADNIDLRVGFLSGDISRTEFEKQIITRDRQLFKREFERDMRLLLVTVTRDVGLRVVRSIGTPEFIDTLTQGAAELRELIHYHSTMIHQFHQDHHLKVRSPLEGENHEKTLP
jgi:hypothetical protein